MSERDESVLLHEVSVKAFDGEKPKYGELTAVSDKEMGELLVTDQRILFFIRFSLRGEVGEAGMSIASFLAGVPSGVVLSEYLASKTSKVKIEPGLIEKVLGTPSSFQIPLKTVVKAEAKKAYLFTNYLSITYRTQRGTASKSFIFGSAAKSRKDLVDLIEGIKTGASSTDPSSGGAAQPFCPSCGQPLTYIDQYKRWYCYACKQYA
jgi:hypothetical protein